MSHNILKLLDKLAPEVRDAFVAAINDVTSNAQLAVIVGHLEAGRIDAALAALNIRPEFFAPLDDALRTAYLIGGRDALAGFPAIADPFTAAAWLRGLTGGTRGPKGS